MGIPSISRSPGANGAGRWSTTVEASGASTFSGIPLTYVSDAKTALTRGSYSAAKEKMTSADVNGAPSENVMPWRSLRVYAFPSLDWVQLSASQGSSVSVVAVDVDERRVDQEGEELAGRAAVAVPVVRGRLGPVRRHELSAASQGGRRRGAAGDAGRLRPSLD